MRNQENKYMAGSLMFFKALKTLTKCTPILLLFFANTSTSYAKDMPGATQTSYAVSPSGAFSFGIPLVIPQGTNGVQPNLSLNFSSSRGNGRVGVGWELNGLSGINRCGQTQGTHGRTKGYDYTSSDRYCLDGKPLILVSAGVYGAAGTEYRTEIDEYSKIVAIGSSPNLDGSTAPARFQVYRKDGTILEYGLSGNSNVKLAGTNVIHCWKVSVVRDRNGNAYQVDYRLADGQPNQVRYTNNGSALGNQFVKFIYESRTDVRKHYAGGKLRTNAHRLSRVDVTKGSSVVRQYKLAYQYSAANQSQLQSVIECGLNGQSCLPPIQIEWQADQKGRAITSDNKLKPPTHLIEYYTFNKYITQGVTESRIKEINRGQWADVNGDGMADLVLAYTTPGGTDVLKTYIKTRTGTGWEEQPQWALNETLRSYENSVTNMSTARFRSDVINKGQLVDVNGDGLVDVVIAYRLDRELHQYRDPSNGISQIEDLRITYINTGNGWQESPAYKAKDYIYDYLGQGGVFGNNGALTARGRFVDLNRDGLVDWVSSFHYRQASWLSRKQAWLNTGSGWTPSTAYAPPSYLVEYYGLAHQWQRADLVDVNGDGLLDWVEAYTSHWDGSHRNTWLNTGDGFETTPSPIFRAPEDIYHYNANTPNVRRGSFIDVNGDRLPDFIRSFVAWSNGNFQQAALLNTGRGWVGSTAYAPPFIDIDYRYANHQGNDGQGNQPGGNWGVQKRGLYLDVDQDGLVDYTQSYKDVFGATHKSTWLNTGQGWSAPDAAYNQATLIFDYSGRGYMKSNFGSLVDINSDGSPDWVQARSDATLASYLNKNGKVNTLDKVVTTMGFEIKPEFSALTSGGSLYTKIPPLITQYIGQSNLPNLGNLIGSDTYTFASAMYVTSAVTTPTPVTGTDSVTTYSYTGARISRSRGFLGFATFTASNNLNLVDRYQEFNQSFPLTGQINRSAVVHDGHVINVSSTEYSHTSQTRPLGTKTHVVQVSSTASQQSELADNGGGAYRTNRVDLAYDAYGNVNDQTTRVSDGDGLVLQTNRSLTTFETPDTANWLISRPKLVSQTNTRTGLAAVTNEIEYQYLISGKPWLVSQRIREPNSSDASLSLVTAYTYDARGNIRTEATYSRHDSANQRVSHIDFDAELRLPNKLTNALGQESTISYHSLCDLKATVTDPNNLVTTYDYDNLCRQTLERSPVGLESIITYTQGNPNGCVECQSDPKFVVTTTAPGQPSVTQTMNAFNQVMLTATQGVDGRIIKQQNDYDYLARKASESQPYYEGETVYWTNFGYDDLGRNTVTSLPYSKANGLRAEMSYAYSVNAQGMQIRSVTDAKGHTTQSIANALDQVEKVINADSQVMEYQFESRGNLKRTIDALGNTTVLDYDILGRRIALNDPSLNTSTYGFNVWGELVTQTNANNHTTVMEYDKLARLVKRTIPGGAAQSGGVSEWIYDTQFVGAIAEVTGPNGYLKQLTYDAFGRLDTQTTTIKGIALNESFGYNADGQLAERYYPSSGTIAGAAIAFGVKYAYQNGYLTSIMSVDDENGQCVEHWRADSYDALGRVDRETVGKLVNTQRVYKGGQNVLERIRSITLGANPQVVQDLVYQYDSLNNLLSREDPVTNTLESFQYDNLDRLTLHSKGSDDVTVSYDAIGNIVSKSDVGNYHYLANANGNNSHKLTLVSNGPVAGSNLAQFQVNWDFNGEQLVRALPSTSSLTFEYDDRGSVTQSGHREIGWTAFDKPERMVAQINADGTRTGSVYEYGPDQQRVYKKEAKFNALSEITVHGESTLYLGKHYQRIEKPNGDVTHRYSIETGSTTIQIERVNNSGFDRPKYLLADHLGSTSAILDNLGNVEQRLAFDPWGLTLNPGDQSRVNSVTNRGYTGHEMDDETGLINMNARIYDPYIGRFLSADPVLPDPGNMQAFNRYAYVMGNPLKYTDPTGNMPDGSNGNTRNPYIFDEDGNRRHPFVGGDGRLYGRSVTISGIGFGFSLGSAGFGFGGEGLRVQIRSFYGPTIAVACLQVSSCSPFGSSDEPTEAPDNPNDSNDLTDILFDTPISINFALGGPGQSSEAQESEGCQPRICLLIEFFGSLKTAYELGRKGNIEEYINRVKTNGIWDFKNRNEYKDIKNIEEFGNFAFGSSGAAFLNGATGNLARLSPSAVSNVLRRGAGAYQQHFQNYDPSWGNWWDIAASSYGDEPKDSVLIDAGVRFYFKSLDAFGGN